MKEYLFTSASFIGYMKFGYDELGILIKFENSAIINDKQLLFMRERFPFVIDQLEHIKGKTGKLTECSDISFEAFWNLYDYKKGKEQAWAQWKKLSHDAHVKAITRIKAYRYDCKSHNRDMVYAERYLRHRRFDDE